MRTRSPSFISTEIFCWGFTGNNFFLSLFTQFQSFYFKQFIMKILSYYMTFISDRIFYKMILLTLIIPTFDQFNLLTFVLDLSTLVPSCAIFRCSDIIHMNADFTLNSFTTTPVRYIWASRSLEKSRLQSRKPTRMWSVKFATTYIYCLPKAQAQAQAVPSCFTEYI